MLRFALLLGLLGLAAATAIIVGSGYHEVVAALAVAGWGILWSCLAHLFPMTFSVVGWRALMPGKKRPSLPFFLYLLWIRAAINNLMPVARIGGEIVAVRLMIKHRIRKFAAVSAIVAEITMSVIAVFLFDVIGIGMFAFHVGARDIVLQLALGLAISVPAIAALVFVQRLGFFGLASRLFTVLFRDKWKNFAGDSARLDRAVHALYRRRRKVLTCFFWQFASWCAGAIEIWLPLQFLHHPLPFAESFMLEALIQATASAAFAVPAALGVQEAGFLLFGHMLGLPADIAAALAVIRRCRDLLLYAPGLVAWQVQEGRWLLARRRT
ncbi:MAG TPA: lysylphosphatidylglycerol synthase domain-containing protein [Alphaproteobacteria bacterium]|nr:lysylphosphatidylglycerol synthase domain-containing protein [Alphaproteobacteria bacterium]